MQNTQYIIGRRAIAAAILSISFLLPSLALAQSKQGTVTSAVDGDTFKVEIDGTTETVRIIGIDTPETVHPSKPVQCFGKEASAALKEVLDGEEVTLEKNPTEERDKYDRLLRYVEIDGVDIGASMIEEGFAYSYKQYPHPRLEEYNELEKEAREENRGLWGSCTGDSGEFSDVSTSHPYTAAIRWGKESGVLSGYPDGTFQPDRTVNRAEFLKIVLAADGIDVASASNPTGFRDVDESAWYAPYIRYAKQQGIVQGYPDGSFKPEQAVNFAEALKMAYVALGISSDASASGAWYEQYLSHARNNEVLFSDNVDVGEGMSRKDVVWIVWRLLEGAEVSEPEPSPELEEEEPVGDSCEIKGNISSTDEKIYHMPGCGSYEKTVIDESAGERWFCSEKEATDAGWRKAGNCY